MKKRWLYLVLVAMVLVSCPSGTTTPPTTYNAKYDTAKFDTAKFEP
jgi:PBP1b-binding outer membrane lipoprotein LpoB